jgi:hypothetical protein
VAIRDTGFGPKAIIGSATEAGLMEPGALLHRELPLARRSVSGLIVASARRDTLVPDIKAPYVQTSHGRSRHVMLSMRD